MPRLSPAVQAARRDQIADAALTCIARHGIAGTSMADIIKASGLSAGSIYSHFESKAEVLRFTAERLLAAQASVTSRTTGIVTPATLARTLVAELTDSAPLNVVLQVWAEVSRDPELRDIATDVLARVHALQSTTLLPWARQHRTDDAAARLLAGRAADTVIGVVHGYLVRSSIDARCDTAALITTLTTGLGDALV